MGGLVGLVFFGRYFNHCRNKLGFWILNSKPQFLKELKNVKVDPKKTKKKKVDPKKINKNKKERDQKKKKVNNLFDPKIL